MIDPWEWDDDFTWREKLANSWREMHDFYKIQKIIQEGLENSAPSVKLPDHFDEWRATIDGEG